MKALVDGDYLAYRHAFAVEKECIEYGRPTAEWNCLYNITEHLIRMLKKIGTDDYVIYLGTAGDITFRHRLEFVDYKANRSHLKKPLLYDYARKVISETFNCETVRGIEADDALGIGQTDDTVIVTIDKDLRMIPGKHYDVNTGKIWTATEFGTLKQRMKRTKKGNVKKITSSGFLQFCVQMITGDTVDNIPGIPKKGPVAAYNALYGCKYSYEAWGTVRSMYMAAGLSMDYARDQADALWIMRQEGQTFTDWMKENVI